jgi:hypothetical protein
MIFDKTEQSCWKGFDYRLIRGRLDASAPPLSYEPVSEGG